MPRLPDERSALRGAHGEAVGLLHRQTPGRRPFEASGPAGDLLREIEEQTR
jgi:hypothetical protein